MQLFLRDERNVRNPLLKPLCESLLHTMLIKNVILHLIYSFRLLIGLDSQINPKIKYTEQNMQFKMIFIKTVEGYFYCERIARQPPPPPPLRHLVKIFFILCSWKWNSHIFKYTFWLFTRLDSQNTPKVQYSEQNIKMKMMFIRTMRSYLYPERIARYTFSVMNSWSSPGGGGGGADYPFSQRCKESLSGKISGFNIAPFWGPCQNHFLISLRKCTFTRLLNIYVPLDCLLG